MPRLKMPKKKSTVRKAGKYDIHKYGISISAIRTWLECREKARLRYVCGWKPKTDQNWAYQGSAMAGLHEVYYATLQLTGSVEDSVSQAMKWSKTKVAKSIKDPNLTTEGKDRIREAHDEATIIFAQYVMHWMDEDESYDWVKVEDNFTVPIEMHNGKEVPFIGKFDGVYDDRGIYLFESKYKARWSNTFIDQIAIDLQVAGYIYALESEGLTVKGGTYNLSRKPGLRRKAKEGYSDYLKRISEDVVDRTDHYFQRFSVTFTKAERKENKDRIIHLCREFYRWFMDADESSRDLMLNNNSCETKYGSCYYLPTCTCDDYSALYNVAKRKR